MAQNRLAPIVAQVLALAETHLTVPVGRATVMPGNTVVQDDCCDGQLWVRVVSIVGVSGLSQPASQPCTRLYQVRLGIGVDRCAHTVNDQGIPPTPGEMTADAFQTYQDQADLVEAWVCSIFPYLMNLNSAGAAKMEDWLPRPVDGGCVGGELDITFNWVMCTPCPPDPSP